LLGLGQVSGHPVGLGRAVAVAAWLVLLLVVGEAPRYRAQQFAAARRARAAETRVAASAERLALARDLHDTIGHSLSMIAVQAGVALHLLDEHPEQARPALTAIRTASKEALEEVRATLSILREEDFEGRPAPGLSRVGDLVAAARVGGLAVHIEPEPLGDSVSRLPDDVDAAAFRVVQEGLTNVARHSAAANATVSIVRSSSSLEVSVVDDGLGADEVVEGGGLRGMRERAAALGGQVEAGPVEGGGFRVAVRFPLNNKGTTP
jgi:signal transduction histidine kinase